MHLSRILLESWALFTNAALYIVFGLCIAGVMHAFVRRERIGRYLGGARLRAVVNAALIGIPLPLCSCGVLPAAVGLRKEGASKAATLSFLISTPESGVDSIAVTYALMGPWMAALRPLAALVTAVSAGVGEILWGAREPIPAPAPATSCCATTRAAATTAGSGGVRQRLWSGLRYAFVDLLADMTPTFLLGILLGGVISSLLPTEFIEAYLGAGWRAMFMMLVVGIPLYICASASTPIAAALMLKGMSPGVALVFLLAGPATNISALPVIARMLGWRSVAIYLGTIALCTLLFGMLTNLFFTTFSIDVQAAAAHVHHPVSTALQPGIAGALLAAMLWTQLRRRSASS